MKAPRVCRAARFVPPPPLHFHPQALAGDGETTEGPDEDGEEEEGEHQAAVAKECPLPYTFCDVRNKVSIAKEVHPRSQAAMQDQDAR